MRVGPVALLKAAIAAIEACDHLIVAIAGGRFGVDQRLGFGAPFLALARVADAAQEMQRAQNLRQPLQVMVVQPGCSGGGGCGGPAGSAAAWPGSLPGAPGFAGPGGCGDWNG